MFAATRALSIVALGFCHHAESCLDEVRPQDASIGAA